MAKHRKKLDALRNEFARMTQDHSTIPLIDPIKNYSKRKLTTKEQYALSNGLDFVYKTSSFNENDFISNVENLFVSLLGRCTDKYDWEVKELNENITYNLTPEQLKYAADLRSISDRFMRNAAKELKSYNNTHKEQLSVLRELANDKSIHITRPDKGKAVVILDQEEYINKMLEILNDSSTFKILNHDPTLKKEDKLRRILSKMTDRKFLSENEYKQACPTGSHCARMYGLPKIHKTGIPLRPVLSAIGSYNYRLAKVLATKLQPYRKSKYMLKDTFDFINSIKDIDQNMVEHTMVSFDVTNLFTKIPLTYTINLILNQMYGPEHNCSKFIKLKSDWCQNCMDRNDMKTLLDIATSDTHLSFNNIYYQQHNGVSMGSPLAPILADIFMIHLENKLMSRLKKAGVLWYKRYVDDTFVIVHKDSDVNNISNILNSVHKDIQFTSVQEQNNELPFLDVLVRRNNKSFDTRVYRKPTYTGLLLKWSSFVPKSYKISVVSSMVYRAIRISSSYTLMHEEFDFIRDITKRNGYPKYFVECQIRHTLNRYIEKSNGTSKNIKDDKLNEQLETHTDKIIINVPYTGKATRQLNKELYKLTKKVKPNTQLITVQRPPAKASNFFKNKDPIRKDCQSHVVYQLCCKDCSAKYIGKTIRQTSRRLKEHGAPTDTSTIDSTQSLRRSARIAEKKKTVHTNIISESSDNDDGHDSQKLPTSAVKRHTATTKHNMDWNNWTILDKDTHPYRLLIKESIAIAGVSPSLNQTTRSAPLIIYPEGTTRSKRQHTTHLQQTRLVQSIH